MSDFIYQYIDIYVLRYILFNMETLKTQLINNHSMNVNMADIAIHEYEKFLILTNMCENSYPTKNIDTIWTTHILNTKHYYDYCNNNFSHTIHRNISGNENHNEKLVHADVLRVLSLRNREEFPDTSPTERSLFSPVKIKISGT